MGILIRSGKDQNTYFFPRNIFTFLTTICGVIPVMSSHNNEVVMTTCDCFNQSSSGVATARTGRTMSDQQFDQKKKKKKK